MASKVVKHLMRELQARHNVCHLHECVQLFKIFENVAFYVHIVLQRKPYVIRGISRCQQFPYLTRHSSRSNTHRLSAFSTPHRYIVGNLGVRAAKISIEIGVLVLQVQQHYSSTTGDDTLITHYVHFLGPYSLLHAVILGCT